MNAAVATPTVTLVDHFTDPEWLSATTGMNVRASWMRIKPDTSVTTALRDRCTGEVIGWARVLWPISHAKAFKCQRFADANGLSVTTTALSPELVLQTGQIAADPKLGKRLRVVPQEVLDLKVLRYNPARRLVSTDGKAVWRITTKRDTGAPLHAFVSEFLPTQARLDTGTHPSVSVLEYVGSTDLAARLPHTQLRRATATAAHYLARLHRAAADLPAPLKETLTRQTVDPAAQQQAHVGVLRGLEPSLAERLDRLSIAPLTAAEPALLHGDASPDQFLLDEATDKVWISDLDRAHLGSAATDLGSYLTALDPSLHEVFLNAYGAHAPLPDAEHIRLAQVHARLLKLMEPLRAGNQQWRQLIAARLDRIEAQLS